MLLMAMTPVPSVLPSLVAVLSAYSVSFPPMLAAYTPKAFSAALMLVASCVTVLLGLAATVIVTSLMLKLLPCVRLVGAKVPCMVGQAVFHSSEPNNTQVLYRSPALAPSCIQPGACAVVGPLRL